MTITQAAIRKDVDAYGVTVKTGKKVFKKLSRDLLTYVYESNDVPMLNRHLDTLDKLQKKMAMQFYPQFVGWDWEKEGERFAKKAKTKVYDKKKALAAESLEDDAFDIWSWYEAKGEKEAKKPKDHAKALDNAIKAGLKETGDNKLTMQDFAKVFMANDIKMRDLMDAATELAGL